MTNPFSTLAKPVEYEEITESALGCQEGGCYEVVTEGKYLRKTKTLTWVCPHGHISHQEIDL